MRSALIRAIAAVTAICAFLFVPARAQEADALANVPAGMREQLVKAAYLFNFAKFTTWPQTAFESANAPVELCVLGKDPFGDTFSALNGERVGARRVATHYVVWAEEIERCHVLFLGLNGKAQLTAVMREIGSLPILTVSDMPSFARLGGMIGLKRTGDKIRFEANPKAAETNGLRISSRLLKLADIVETETTVGLVD